MYAWVHEDPFYPGIFGRYVEGEVPVLQVTLRFNTERLGKLLHTLRLSSVLITSPLNYFSIVVVVVGAMDVSPLKSISGVFNNNVLYGLNNHLMCYGRLSVEKDPTKDHG